MMFTYMTHLYGLFSIIRTFTTSHHTISTSVQSDHLNRPPRCQPSPVYVQNAARCMPTPRHAPLSASREALPGLRLRAPLGEGMAGLVHFRKACRPVPVTGSWSSLDGTAELGHFAWRNEWKEHKCFAALVPR